jgi:hypothetical protein
MQLEIILVPTIFAIVCWSLGYATGIQSRYNKPHAEYTRGWVECERLYARYVQERYSEGFATGYAAANDDGSEKEI